MNRRKYYKYILLLGVTLLFTGCHSSADGNSTAMYTEDNMNYFGSEKTQIEEITNIDIQTNYANVEMIASDDYYIEYEFYYVDEKPEIRVENGTLYFDDSVMNSDNYSIQLKENCYIKLYVPNTAEFEHVSIHNNNGEVTLGTFSTQKLEVNKSYGSLMMSRLEAEDVKIALSAGSLLIENCNFKNAEMENFYGEINLNSINKQAELSEEALMQGEIKVNTTSGNIIITDLWCESLVSENTHGNIELEGISAEYVQSFQSSGNYSYNGYIGKSINIQSIHGDAELLLQGMPEDYRIEAKSEHGSVLMNGTDYGEEIFRNDTVDKQIEVEVKSGNIDISFKG